MKKNGKKGFAVYSLTDIGRKRKNNEDSFLCAEVDRGGEGAAYLMAVADGMGGHEGGEVASRRVVEVLEQYVASNSVADVTELLKGAIEEANSRVYEMACEVSELQGMGSTCTAMLWTQGKTYIAHVGDSRAYLVRNSELTKLTKDHTVAEEMVECGVMTPEKARKCPERHLLLRAVGTGSEIEVDLVPPIRTSPGDIFVLCSDGLTEFVEEDEIRDIVSLNTLDEACRILIGTANERGGSDNITVQVAKALGNGKSTFRILDGVKSFFGWMRALKGS